MEMNFNENVILCRLCGFRGLSFFQIARHLRSHSEASFRCGIEDCPSLFTDVTFFQSHLRDIHEDIYPNIQSVLPELVNSSLLTLTLPVKDLHHPIMDLPRTLLFMKKILPLLNLIIPLVFQMHLNLAFPIIRVITRIKLWMKIPENLLRSSSSNDALILLPSSI